MALSDRSPTAQFFSVKLFSHPTGQNLSDYLAEIGEITTPKDRERKLEDDALVRLHQQKQTSNGLHEFDMLRRQLDGIPPQASEDDVEPIKLPDNTGLGHLSAAIYDLDSKVLVFQHNRNFGGINRLKAYLEEAFSGVRVNFSPIAAPDAWQRFAQINEVTKLKFRVSADGYSEPDSSSTTDPLANARKAGFVANGPFVTVEIGMGRRRGALNFEFVSEFLKRIRKRQEVDGAKEVQSLTVTGKNPDVSGSVIIKFIEQFLIYRDIVTLDSANLIEAYGARQRFLRKGMNKHKEHLESFRG